MKGQINMMGSTGHCVGIIDNHFKMMFDWPPWGRVIVPRTGSK